LIYRDTDGGGRNWRALDDAGEGVEALHKTDRAGSDSMLEVIRMHRDSVRGIKPEHVQTELFLA